MTWHFGIGPDHGFHELPPTLETLMRTTLLTLTVTLFLSLIAESNAASLDEMALDRWAKLREVERYQLNIAEKYYREKNYKVALAEYEKFLTLYETSEGAPYSQLKWSLCLVRLRKLNTAISDGFQSVIDYWPEAPEATAAAYYIGQCYKNTGETRKARKAYQNVLKKYPNHLAAAYSLSDLADLASITKDLEAQVSAWQKLTFDVKRTRESSSICQAASRSLAVYCFTNDKFSDGAKALETTYGDGTAAQVAAYSRQPILNLTGQTETRQQGEKLADQAAEWIRGKVPGGTTAEEQTAARTIWFYIADIQAASRRPKKVVETYNLIQKQFGGNDETHGRLANWLKTQDRYDDARTEFRKFKDRIEGQNQVSYSFRQQKRYGEAVLGYQKNVTDDAEHQARWNSEIAATHREAKEYPQAIAVYQGLLKSDVDNTDKWLWETANTYRDSGKYKDAIAWYKQCNNFPSNYQQMAACHRQLKSYREAVILYGQIVGGSPPTAAWALLQIGYTQEQASSKEQAIAAFQQVCKRYPKSSYASTAHAHLQNKYKISVTLGGAKEE